VAWFNLGGPETEDLPLACDQLAVATISGQQWAKRNLGSNHGDEGGNVLHMDGHVDFLRAAAQGNWPANQPKLRAWDRGQWREPANADRSPDD
jgi:prepilin-type processing-associated H-X9-DG protein